MNIIILKAISEYNLSPDEDYYLDDNNCIRARGFFYDEDTGICVNILGNLERSLPSITNDCQSIRQELGICTMSPFIETLELEVAAAVIV